MQAGRCSADRKLCGSKSQGAVPLLYLKAQVGTDGLVVRDEQVGTGVGQLLDWACTPSEEHPVRPGRRAPLFLLHTHTARESLGTTSFTPAAVGTNTAFSPPVAGSRVI